MSIKRRVTSVVIYQGDDLERIGELRLAAEVAERIHREAERGSARTADIEDAGIAAQEARAAHDAFVDEAAERAEVVGLQALGRRQWRDLVAAHPPRRVTRVVDDQKQDLLHEDDEQFGVNAATFGEALLTYIDPNRPDMRTITAPEFPTAQGVRDYLDDLSSGDFDRLWVTAYYLNAAPGSDPQSSRYSVSSPISPEISE